MDIDALPKVMGDDGEFHAVDEVVDLSGTTMEAWASRWAVLAAGGDGVLPVLHALRAQRLGVVDRGDRALPADRRGLRRCAIGVAKNNHIQVDLLYRYLPAGVSRACWPRWWTCCAWPSSAR
jgi:hypothetical protein